MIQFRSIFKKRLTILLVLGLIFTPESVFSFQNEEDYESLLRHAKRVVVDPNEVFLGLGAKWTTNPKIGPKFDIHFDQLKKNVWRINKNWPGQQDAFTVAARDEGFSFTAARISSSVYIFESLGDDDLFHREVQEKIHFPFRDTVYKGNGISLKDLLNFNEFKVIKWLKPEIHQGFRVVGIEFSAIKEEITYRGSLSWLPEQKNMLRNAKLMVDVGDVRKDKFIGDVTIDYEFYEDRLLPWRIVSKSADGSEKVSTLDEVRPANPDRSYYTAEALGLETPKRPRPRWITWGVLAVVFIAVGLFFWKRR